MASISQSAAEEALRRVDRTAGAEWPATAIPHVTSHFGWRLDPFEPKKAQKRRLYHTGIDVRASTGTPINSLWPGVVFRTWKDELNGHAIRVLHLASPEIVSGYAHLETVLVSPGDIVLAGQQIGTAGNTGRTTKPHLHFCCSIDRQWVDPLAALQQRWTVEEFAKHTAAGDVHPKV